MRHICLCDTDRRRLEALAFVIFFEQVWRWAWMRRDRCIKCFLYKLERIGTMRSLVKIYESSLIYLDTCLSWLPWNITLKWILLKFIWKSNILIIFICTELRWHGNRLVFCHVRGQSGWQRVLTELRCIYSNRLMLVCLFWIVAVRW